MDKEKKKRRSRSRNEAEGKKKRNERVMGNVLSGWRQVHGPYKVKRPYEVDSHSGSTINAGRFARASPSFHARSYYGRLRCERRRRKPEPGPRVSVTTKKGVCFSWISTEIGRGPGDEPLGCKSPGRRAALAYTSARARSLSPVLPAALSAGLRLDEFLRRPELARSLCPLFSPSNPSHSGNVSLETLL